MAVTGLPKLGGAYSSGGPQKGQYHVKVADATICEAKDVAEGRTSKRLGYKFQYDVFEDPNHAAKNGKKLANESYWLPDGEDDEDKQKTMRGMLKRSIFDGFKIDWPASEEPVDPRDWIGKTAYVLVDEQKDNRSDEIRTRVVAISQDPAKLPKLKTSVGTAGGAGKEQEKKAATGGTKRGRR